MGRTRPLIGVNIRVSDQVASGVSRVVVNLTEQLLAGPWDWDFVLYASRMPDPASRIAHAIGEARDSRHVRLRTLRGGSLSFELATLPAALALDRPDVLINTTPESLVPHHGACVVLAHDTLPEVLGNKLPLRLRCWRALGMYRRTLNRATRVVCPSENTRRDLVRFYGLNEGHIVVAPYAVDRAIRRIDHDTARRFVTKRFNIPNRFVFMVNTAHFERFLTSYARYRQQSGTRACDLVILGRPHPFERYEALIANLGEQDHVHWIQGVTDQELSNLYSGAMAFVCPSYYEGFGLAPLEAMACGTATIAYDTSSLPEVVAGGGILVPPDDANAMARALTSLCSPEDVDGPASQVPAELSHWRQRALEVASTYSWDVLGNAVGDAVLASLSSTRNTRCRVQP